MKKTVIRLAAALLLCLIALFFAFYELIRLNEKNNESSSASHLAEINREAAAMLELCLRDDDLAARNLAQELSRGKISDENDLNVSIRFCLDAWHISDVYIYTEDGHCYNADGEAAEDVTSAAFAAEVTEREQLPRITKGRTEYAVSVTTDTAYRGSQIVAVSAVHNLATLIDDVNLSSFGGQGSFYLTHQNGATICQSSGSAVPYYRNMVSAFGGNLRNLWLPGSSLEKALSKSQTSAFLYDPEEGTDAYVVVSPLAAAESGESLCLFNVVPRAAVNASQNTYTTRVAVTAVSVILAAFALFAAFFYAYRRKTRKFDQALEMRDRATNLLVTQTNNAFALLDENAPKAVFASINYRKFFGGVAPVLIKNEAGYRLMSARQGQGEGPFARINESLQQWDGKSEYVSGYLPYTENGETRQFRVSIVPVEEKPGEFIGITQDVTPEYRREESLWEALTLADSANRAKTRFLSGVSHDIRTPLNAIINITRFLQQDPQIQGEAARQLQIVQQSSGQLLSLINDVLDMSRIESGRLSFSNTDFNMEQTVEELCGIIRPLCDEKQQTFLTECPPLHRPAVNGDAVRLRRILMNLLNNAVKYTQEGGSITFSVTELPTIKTEEVPFRFSVRDNGIGIAPENQNRIFEAFSRVDVHKSEGHGLGLAITKRFIDALGGTITVESQPGEGSVFTVELTYRAADTAAEIPAASAEPARFDGKRCLLAEDNAINQAIARQILEGWGMEVETALTGAAALALFKAHPAFYYDLVYMDIQMPEMDGYETAAAIRALNTADAAAVPVIAMTANAFAEDVERARAAGMNGHIAKPIDVEELHRITLKMLRQRSEDSEPDKGQ